ncbi:MAG: glycosyl hydrolase family 2 [Tidjanibacter sp.]|nr:glycosyl hydrolase family 2 [Tidjanibacter sp.]
MKRLLLIFHTLLLVAVGSLVAQENSHWYPIEKEHRPYVRWWWLGSAVDYEGITYNMEEFSRQGFGGVEITPIYGVQGNEHADIDYLSPRWMEMYKHTRAEGKRLGIGVDMNNGTGWPFGGPQVNYDTSAQKFIIEEWTLSANTPFTHKILPSDRKQHEVAELVAMQALSGDRRVDISNYVGPSHQLLWNVPDDSDWKIYALFAGRTRQRVKRAAPGGEGLVVNHYDSCALRIYLDRFEKAFRESGAEYPETLFNDSFEVYGASWDEKMPQTFIERNGYALTDYLPELAGGGDAEIRARVVSDYRETLAEMLLENFTIRWSEWAHRHGSLTRNQAHGSPANLIDLYAAVDIPECESFGRSDFDLAGLRSDSIRKPNDGTPAVLKFASSAAHLTGKKTVSAEALTWLTEHFRTSLSQCKPEIDLMFAAGVNHVVFHGAPYSPKGAEFPAWRFYASINMSPTAAFWRDVRPLTDYIARCQSFLSAGEPDNDLLVYLPLYDIWHEQQDSPFLIFDIHKMDKTMPQVKATMDGLVSAGFDADYLSDRYLSTLYVDRDGMIISEGGARYRALMVPACHKMPTESLEKVVTLARKGATIIFSEHYPDDVPGLRRIAERDEFKRLLKRLPDDEDFGESESFRCGRGRVITGSNFDEMCRMANIRPETFKSQLGGTMLRRRNEVGGYNYFLSMLREHSVDGWVSLATDGAAAIILDPLTGKVGKAQIRHNEQGTIDVKLQMRSGESLLIKTFAQDVECEAWRYISHCGTPLEIERGWSISFPESAPSIDGHFKIDTLCDWTTLPDDRARVNQATARYEVRFLVDNPDEADDWSLDLGDVRESAVVIINGRRVATLTTVPFVVRVGEFLIEGENVLQVDVTNLPSNRIADYERRGVHWRIFKDANISSVTGAKQFSFGDWLPDPSGLNSNVVLTPIYYEK